MTNIENKSFGGERPLFNSHDLFLDSVTILEGESALKECRNVTCTNCRFEGKYPLWHNNVLNLTGCFFTEDARAAIWYSDNITITNSIIHAPKTMRELDNININTVKLDGDETLWQCRNINITGSEFSNSNYFMFHSDNAKIYNITLNGKYSFQYCRNIEIHDSFLDTKDAFWESENVIVYDSTVKGEYLGWHSKNLKLINCIVSGTQPLCYAENLVLENCIMEPDADLAFEYSSVNADIKSDITSIKNPLSGKITTYKIKDIIIDENLKKPRDCIINETDR